MNINFSAKVLVVGDVILDQYVNGVVERISPEAPIPIVKVQNINYRLGGAANVALNIAKLGIQVGLVGIVGNDQNGNLVKELLSQNDIVDLLISDDSSTTILKQRVVSKSQQIVRVDYEAIEPVDHGVDLEIVFSKHLQDYDVVILSDYNKGVLNNVSSFIATCRRHNKFCLVDPKKQDITYYRGANLIKPNLLEFTTMLGCDTDLDVLRKNMTKASIENQIDQIMVTMGADGVILRKQDGCFVHSKATAKSVYDVSGAGDTVCAITAIGIASGWSLENSVQLGNKAAGVVIGKFGTETLEIQEFNALVETIYEDEEVARQKNINDLDSLKAEIKGKKIVFTNGCFDILHIGHIEYLTASRKLGDVLIVGVNSDESVKRLKGPKRPINECSNRLKMLKALECVDYAVSFDEDTPIHLIEQLQPDVLTKGGDYIPDEVVGYDFMTKLGKVVKIIPYKHGYSTSELIDSIVDAE